MSVSVARRIYEWIIRIVNQQTIQVPVDSIDGNYATGIPLGWSTSVTVEISPHLTLTEGDIAVCQKLGPVYLAYAVRPSEED